MSKTVKQPKSEAVESEVEDYTSAEAKPPRNRQADPVITKPAGEGVPAPVANGVVRTSWDEQNDPEFLAQVAEESLVKLAKDERDQAILRGEYDA